MKEQKTILIEFSDEITNFFFKKLKDNFNIHTCITNNFKCFNTKNFPKTNFIHNHDCVNGRNFTIKKITDYYSKLNNNEKETLLFLLKRQNPNKGLSIVNKIKFINYLFTGWNKYLKKNNINFIIFFLNPHLTYSYIIYLIAIKKKINLKILENNKYLRLCYFTNKIENYPIKFRKNNSKTPELISQYTKQFLCDKKIKPHNEGENNTSLEYIKIFYRVYLKIFLKPKEIFKYFFLKQPHSFHNYNNNLPYKENSKHSKFIDNFYYFKAFNCTNKIKNYYLQNSISLAKLPKNKKYILFAANFQPEKTTCPDGSKFFDQIKALKILNNFCEVNNNYKILYKEHPAQFLYKKFGFIIKDESFYNQLFRLKNIYFLKKNTDIKDSISISSLVTTVTGEAGLQSLLLEKPSLVFGFPWYKNFKYISHINDIKKLNLETFNKITTNKIEYKKVANELKKIQFRNTLNMNFKTTNNTIENNFDIKNIKINHDIEKILEKQIQKFKKGLKN